MMRTILILGGTGVFGKRLARHLAQYPDIEVIVSSRTEEKAQAIAKEIKAEYPDYAIYGEGLNHQHCFREALEGLKPFAVVDCSGPFQTADYDVADTVLHTGSHLIDLADARNYLSNFAAHLEESADDNEVCAFTGASSSPTLSGCVVRHLVEGWRRVDTIDMCITPGGKTEVGRSAIEAIMTYAGEPVPTWRNGKIEEIIGWGHSETVDVPGLGQRRISPVETIDPELLGDMYNVQSRVTFSAGLESWLEQWGMEALARLRKNRLLPHPERFTSFLLKARKLTRTFTTDRGGMRVEVRGLNAAGEQERAEWSLFARDGDSPFVPILPAAALLRRLLNGDVKPGARYAFEDLTLSDIADEMVGYSIWTNIKRDTLQESAFRNNLGTKPFDAMPSPIRVFHSPDAPVVWSGKADVETGRGPLHALITRLFGLPKAGRDIEVTVAVDRPWKGSAQSERWVRDFAGNSFHSVLTHHEDGTFTERFGPMSFKIGLKSDSSGLEMPVTGWHFGPIPMPRFLAPKSEAREYRDEEGRFVFDVRLSLPIVGLLAHYKGWLKPVERRRENSKSNENSERSRASLEAS